MHIFQTVFDWYMANLNYFTIYLLMTVESSFIPFPSEIVVPFAAWKAGEGSLSLAGVLLSSTAGALWFWP
jgi:membrane protein DedA with SNARE-associated domain